jgi:hypothetical protein
MSPERSIVGPGSLACFTPGANCVYVHFHPTLRVLMHINHRFNELPWTNSPIRRSVCVDVLCTLRCGE